MKKRRIIIAVINVVVVAAMVLFDMLYMKRIKKRNLYLQLVTMSMRKRSVCGK